MKIFDPKWNSQKEKYYIYEEKKTRKRYKWKNIIWNYHSKQLAENSAPVDVNYLTIERSSFTFTYSTIEPNSYLR